MTHEEEVTQTGTIERGIVWAISRVGISAMRYDPGVLARIRSTAAEHPNPDTRRVAAWALRRLERDGE